MSTPARRTVFLAAAVATLCAILYRFPPTEYPFYPQCPIWTLLHLRCPGCGSTRALAALLHGQLGEALRWNALTVSALPVLLFYVFYGFYGSARAHAPRRHRPASSPWTSRAPIYAGLVLVAAFTVARNL